MVWGGIFRDSKTRLVIIRGNLTAQRYRDEILQPVLLPFIEQQPCSTLLQQDEHLTPYCKVNTGLHQQYEHSCFAMASIFS